jgi:hypothetical protein
MIQLSRDRGVIWIDRDGLQLVLDPHTVATRKRLWTVD